jgi:hypothetical protein
MMSEFRREQVAKLAGTLMLRLLPGLVAGLIVALAFAPALAQPHYVRLTGWVQWIAGEKLMLVLDNGSGVVPVDLARVPLDEYSTLTQRDQVMVIGVVSEDNRGVFGASITRIPDWGIWEDQGP